MIAQEAARRFRTWWWWARPRAASRRSRRWSSTLPADFPAPIVIAQHLDPGARATGRDSRPPQHAAGAHRGRGRAPRAGHGLRRAGRPRRRDHRPRRFGSSRIGPRPPQAVDRPAAVAAPPQTVRRATDRGHPDRHRLGRRGGARAVQGAGRHGRHPGPGDRELSRRCRCRWRRRRSTSWPSSKRSARCCTTC